MEYMSRRRGHDPMINDKLEVEDRGRYDCASVRLTV